MYGKLCIILAYSKKGKDFATFYQEKCGEITCTKNILKKMHFSHGLQCKRHIINLLIFNFCS